MTGAECDSLGVVATRNDDDANADVYDASASEIAFHAMVKGEEKKS